MASKGRKTGRQKSADKKGGKGGAKKEDISEIERTTSEEVIPVEASAMEMKTDGDGPGAANEGEAAEIRGYGDEGPPTWILKTDDEPGGLFSCCGSAGPPATEMISKVKGGKLEFEVTGVSQDAGYDPSLFLAPKDVEQFICVSCMFILRDGQEMECGHCVCDVCLESIKASASLVCPEAEDPEMPCAEAIVLGEVRSSRMAKRVLKKVQVKCNRAGCSDGDEKAEENNATCPWTGPLPKLEEHIESCTFQYATCPFGCSTGEIGRHDMTEKGHYDNCPEFPLECQSCNEFYSRRLTKAHDDICELKIIPCRLGCGKDVMRKDMMDHIKDSIEDHVMCVEKRFAAEFSDMDADGSGTTDFEEFKTHMTKIGLKVPDKKLKALFDQIDLDNSGEIDKDEFNTMLKQHQSIIAKYPKAKPAEILKKVIEAVDSRKAGLE